MELWIPARILFYMLFYENVVDFMNLISKDEENFVNELEVEFVIKHYNEGIYETKSHVIL